MGALESSIQSNVIYLSEEFDLQLSPARLVSFGLILCKALRAFTYEDSYATEGAQ